MAVHITKRKTRRYYVPSKQKNIIPLRTLPKGSNISLWIQLPICRKYREGRGCNPQNQTLRNSIAQMIRVLQKVKCKAGRGGGRLVNEET